MPKTSTSETDDLKLAVGDTDSSGDVITRVFDKQTGKYIIYETQDGVLKCGDAGITLKQDGGIDAALMAIGNISLGSS